MKTSLRVLALLVLAGCENSLEPQKPRLYACDRSAGLNSCPGGWRCGLSGYCQSPDQGLPYACESSEDCSAGWRCGAELLCYDRDAARDRSCRLELETSADTSDCAPGWRCGREARGEVCHQRDAGAAYSCTSDLDCEAGWRCGIEGACVDVAAQRLTVADVMVTPSKVSPLLPSEVDLVQLRFDFFGMSQLVFASGNTLTLATNTQDTSALMPIAQRASAPLLRTAHALAMTDLHALVTDSAGLVDYYEAFDGGNAVLLDPTLANAELRIAPANQFFSTQEELAAFSGSTVGICGRSPTNFYQCDPVEFQFATLPAAVNDVAFIDEVGPGNSFRRSVLAATSEGPFFAPREYDFFVGLDGGPTDAGPQWRRVALPGLSNACAATPVALDRVAYDLKHRMLAVTSDQDRRLSFFNRPSTPHNFAACGELAFDREYGPCAACGPGERLVKLGSSPDSLANDHTVITLCQAATADGGRPQVVAYQHHSTDGGCNLVPLPLPEAVRRGYRVGRESFGLQGIDGTGLPRECPQAGCETMLFSRAPDRVAGGPALLEVHNDDVLEGFIRLEQPSGVMSPLGLRRLGYPDSFVTGSIVENPDWQLGASGSRATPGDRAMLITSMSRTRQDPLSRPFALLNRSSDLLPSLAQGGNGVINATETKAFGNITPDAEGTPWLIIGAGDRIWAEDARLIVEDAGVRTINIKTVPMPSAEIQSIAFAAFDRGDAGTGPLLEGYTVEQNRLFHIRVHSAQLWLPDEIRIGETGIIPVAVWMEGKRGRVGTSDGRVFGLPIPVPLSPVIPEAPLPTVLNYGALCGQAFALSSTALYRLSSGTQPQGTWSRVSLESAQPGLDSFGPHWSATMHKARVGNVEHLYLFSETGLVVDVFATCAQ